MRLPDHLAQAVLAKFPHPGAAAGPESGSTVGLEAYIRVFARLWELLGKGDALPYWTGDAQRDPRIGELQDILTWVRSWMQWNAGITGVTPTERSSYGFSYQLFYDIQSCIVGTLGLIRDLERRWTAGGAKALRLLMRKLNQDSLESFFGAVRQALGGKRDVSVKDVLTATDNVEARKRDREAVVANKRKRNAGGRSDRRVSVGRKKQRKAAIAAASAMDGSGDAAAVAAAAAAACSSV